MEARTNATVWMQAPPEAVFAYIGNPTRHGEWTKAPLKVTGPTPVEQGARYRSQSVFMGKPVEADLRITAYQPTARIGFDAVHKEGAYHHEFTLTPENGGTTVQRTVVLPPAGALKTLLLKFLIAPTAVKSDAKKSLKMLKTMVEGGSSARRSALRPGAARTVPRPSPARA
jgi:uncharacterized protein YndB with AHSA1/START domain